jgi:hypothetical protein
MADSSIRVPHQAIQHRSFLFFHQLHHQRHLTDGVGGAGQAGIVGSHRDFDLVE